MLILLLFYPFLQTKIISRHPLFLFNNNVRKSSSSFPLYIRMVLSVRFQNMRAAPHTVCRPHTRRYPSVKIICKRTQVGHWMLVCKSFDNAKLIQGLCAGIKCRLPIYINTVRFESGSPISYRPTIDHDHSSSSKHPPSRLRISS